MISLSVPSYSPTARARVTIDLRHEQLRHGVSARASGSPHRSQIGGVIGRTDRQQVAHTHPCVGSSSTALQTAQAGARSALTQAIAVVTALGISDLGLGIRPNRVIRDLGLGIRAVTAITRSAHSNAPLMTHLTHATFFLWDRVAPRLYLTGARVPTFCDGSARRACPLRRANQANTTHD
jgi:hypothetical protein